MPPQFDAIIYAASIWVIPLIIAITFHEAAHGYVARFFGAIAMKDRSPFGIAGLWENWKDPVKGEWVRTFAILTTPANDLVARIHDRMPAS